MELVHLYVRLQLLLTIFLVVLLWSLYIRLRRQEFFRWWAWAWTAFAGFLGLASVVLQLPPQPPPLRSSALLLMLICGFLQVPLLIFGAWSLPRSSKPTRAALRMAIGAAFIIAALTFAWSAQWPAGSLPGFAMRTVPRSLTLAVALLFCAWVFLRQWWRSRSWAVGITGTFCLLYAGDQSVYTVVYGRQLLAGLTSAPAYSSFMPAGSTLFLLDLVNCFGICLGMVLLLVEAHKETENALWQSDNYSREIAASNAALQAEILERQRVEAALRESEDRYRDLVENSQDLLCTHDLEGRLLSVNLAPARILEYEVEELLHMSMLDLIAPEFRDQFWNYIARIRTEGVAEGYLCLLTRSGERRVWEYHNTLRTEGVPVPIVRGLAHDVTERTRAEHALHNSEQQLRQVQKMEAVGRLAGGIAHDFNNFLLGITLNIEQALRQLGPKDYSLMDYLDQALNAALSAASVTRRLLTFSRRQGFQPQPVNLNDVVITTKDLLDRLGGENIHIELKLQSDLGRVRSDPVQLQQVILNLMLNARDAMQQGGQITIRTEDVALQEIPRRESFISIPLPGQYVVLGVSDTGTGMDAETLSHLFEPFFTTKQAATAAGLGLPICYGIVTQSEGHISVVSAPGRGTTIRVYLPLLQGRGTEAQPQKAELSLFDFAHPHATRTVLVVDDTEVVRNAVARDLRGVGYSVLAASNATEALLLCDQHKGPIHLLVADIVMPGMNGRELSRHLLRNRPDLKILLMTGYDKDTIASEDPVDASETVLYKPFSSLELFAALGKLLDREAA
jgi:PAS domain S-box-containing protein